MAEITIVICSCVAVVGEAFCGRWQSAESVCGGVDGWWRACLGHVSVSECECV